MKDSLLYISDSIGHKRGKDKIAELLCGCGLSDISFCDFFFTYRGAFNYEIYDMRKFFSADCPYNISGLTFLGETILRYITTKRFMHKKCLVLDCDNVLWGGALEELGINGVELDTLYPANVYLSFQTFVKWLSEKGVTLALCRNNAARDVRQLICR